MTATKDKIKVVLQELYEYSYMQAVHDERDSGKQVQDPMTVDKATEQLHSLMIGERLDEWELFEAKSEVDEYTQEYIDERKKELNALQADKGGSDDN